MTPIEVRHIIEQNMEACGLSKNDKSGLLVAISGGCDSVSLLHALHSLRWPVVAAHCNFHLRGDESLRDERFVADLCRRLNVPLRIKHFDVAAHRNLHPMSVEMACRELRYEWFEQLRRQEECAAIAVAHHADDQIETFFLNLLRGTGLTGLTGMKAARDHIVRPLLNLHRADLLVYLRQVGEDFVTDSTNAQNEYRRNALRNVVLPTLSQSFPQAGHGILTTMSHLRESDALYRQLISQAGHEALVPHPTLTRYRTSTLRRWRQPDLLLYELIKPLGFNREQCKQVFSATVGSHFFSQTHTLTLSRETIDLQLTEYSSKEEVQVDFSRTGDGHGILHISLHDNPPFSPQAVDGKTTVAFSTQLLQCRRVVLRHWRKGDRMRPFGLRGSKLISDLFTDLKLDEVQRKAVWLLEADGQILWMLGHRAAQSFLVSPGSSSYVLLSTIS